MITESGRLRWTRMLTPKGESIDDLLAHNIITVRTARTQYGQLSRPARLPIRRPAKHTDRQPDQLSLVRARRNLAGSGYAREPQASSRHCESVARHHGSRAPGTSAPCRTRCRLRDRSASSVFDRDFQRLAAVLQVDIAGLVRRLANTPMPASDTTISKAPSVAA